MKKVTSGTYSNKGAKMRMKNTGNFSNKGAKSGLKHATVSKGSKKKS